MVVKVIVQRDVLVVALDEPAAGRVVTRRGQRQSGVFAERRNRLHQPLAEGLLPHHEPAIVILNRA